MWFGVPFGFVLASCCCCCVLQFFCHTVPRRVRKRRYRHRRLLGSGTRRRIDPLAGDDDGPAEREARSLVAPRAHGRDRIKAVLEARRHQRRHAGLTSVATSC